MVLGGTVATATIRIIVVFEEEVKMSKSKTNFDQMKYEVANELGVNLKQGYNGDLPSRDAGRVGGTIVKKVFQNYNSTHGMK